MEADVWWEKVLVQIVKVKEILPSANRDDGFKRMNFLKK